MIELNQISISYGGKKILENVSFQISEGLTMALVGRNGAGKTSLVKALSGLVEYHGELVIDGSRVRRKDYMHKSKLGIYLSANGFLTMDVSLKDHFQLIYELYRKPDRFFTKLTEYCKMLHLPTDDINPIRTYSEGMKQKVLFISAIVHQPRYLLLDEPFNFLDEQSVLICLKILEELTTKGIGILLITHDSHIIEKACDKVIFLSKKKCSDEYDVNEIINSDRFQASDRSFLIYNEQDYSK